MGAAYRHIGDEAFWSDASAVDSRNLRDDDEQPSFDDGP